MKQWSAIIHVTSRCNSRSPGAELSLEALRRLPKLSFVQIAGEEPFLREDLPEILRILETKSKRIVAVTNGAFPERTAAVCREFPRVGIRIALEGLEDIHDAIRGQAGSFRRGYETLESLQHMGVTDLGVAMTIQDANARDIFPLFCLTDMLGLDFSVALAGSGCYGQEKTSPVRNPLHGANNLALVIQELLCSRSPQKWLRAYDHHNLICGMFQQPKMLHRDTFFLDTSGNVMLCSGNGNREAIGNLNTQSWEELWNSPQTKSVREKAERGSRNGWTMASAFFWVLVHKTKALFFREPYSIFENKGIRAAWRGLSSRTESDLDSGYEGGGR